MFLSTALMCLSMNIFHESRGEPLEGRIAVANVTMTRAKNDARNVCRVVLKRKQFSWTLHTKKVGGKTWVNPAPIAKEPVAWAKAVILAQFALWGLLPERVDNATHFHTVRVSPYWKDHYVMVAQIGDHIFYK